MIQSTRRGPRSAARACFFPLAGAFLFGAAVSGLFAADVPTPAVLTNSIGMELVRIEAGTFWMGCLNPTPLSELRPSFDRVPYVWNGDWDEHPAHEVTIPRVFHMGATEVTVEQFRKFRPDFPETDTYAPFVSGVSWDEAASFCRWLSEREGKVYRLPTEAEWEYACRAGSTTWFFSGEKLPAGRDVPNGWGLEGLHAPPLEWCSDWHGIYPDTPQMDPVGPASGVARVLRGGGLDAPKVPYYLRSANRAGYAPDFPSGAPATSDAKDRRRFPAGFRVVLGTLSTTPPRVVPPPFVRDCVSQVTTVAVRGPDPKRPYFRKRPLHPVPPENLPKGKRRRAVQAAGLHPALLDHQHSPAMEILANGDVLAVYYTSDHENEGGPEVALMGSRLRFGAEAWDLPDLLIDFPDSNDHAPLLWNDAGAVRLFWGNRSLPGAAPFNEWVSQDHGATFSPVKFPTVRGRYGADRQPVNTAFRDAAGTQYFGMDAGGTMLWASSDNGATWFDPGGHTRGRHTTFAPLPDGRILGIGGKDAELEETNPRAVSSDGGKSWEHSTTPFPPLGSNQRPSLLRLQSGRLLFATDFQDKWGRQPARFQRRGAHLAYSEDLGETWTLKRLPGALGHEHAHVFARAKASTIGYSVLRQGPNGLIHLITSVTHPDLHFAFNEAWLLAPEEEETPSPQVTAGEEPLEVEVFEERYPGGALRARWRGGVRPATGFVLHGLKTFFWESGKKKWEVTYDQGRKVGEEIYWRADGSKRWVWHHNDDGTSVWTRFWENGERRSQSTWRNFRCEGLARRWSRGGHVVDRIEFHDGMPVGVTPETPMTGAEYR